MLREIETEASAHGTEGQCAKILGMSKSSGSSEDMQLALPRRVPQKKQHWCHFLEEEIRRQRKKPGVLQTKEGNMPRLRGVRRSSVQERAEELKCSMRSVFSVSVARL